MAKLPTLLCCPTVRSIALVRAQRAILLALPGFCYDAPGCARISRRSLNFTAPCAPGMFDFVEPDDGKAAPSATLAPANEARLRADLLGAVKAGVEVWVAGHRAGREARDLGR